MNILVISSVLPYEKTGGGQVLRNHLKLMDAEVFIASFNCHINNEGWNLIEIERTLIIDRLKKTRCGLLIHTLGQLFNKRVGTDEIVLFKNIQPDLIITVAHGELCWFAEIIAHKLDVPLVTFFHDWWPDSAFVYDWSRPLLNKRFLKLYRNSDVALCVSDQMRDQLGGHAGAVVLYPIPAHINTTITNRNINNTGRPYRIVYAGNLSGIYGMMLFNLAVACESSNNIRLSLYGPHPDLKQEDISYLKYNGVYGGMLDEGVLKQELEHADLLLVVMSFEEKDKRRMQTSFPSKLVTYSQMGIPIVIWGPEYCSAAVWARQYEAAKVISLKNPADVMKEIKVLKEDKIKLCVYKKNAKTVADTVFNPMMIQSKFLETLYSVLNLDANILNNNAALQ